jgi:hypothetical protein
MEALADAKRRYKPSEDRIYLTGHSMGGHGAWYLGATFPDQWGAIGPCAGWPTFWSYGGAVRYEDPDPIEAMLLRAANVSDLTKLMRNYLHHGVFVLHGDADQTVPVSLARQMRESLSVFHRDLDWHEEKGGGHWYDNTPEPGADCVDYGPMFEFFDRHRRRLSRDVRRVEFTTVSPSVSSKCHWVEVLGQAVPMNPSTVVATNPIGTSVVKIETTNVTHLRLDMSKSPVTEEAIQVEIDGQVLGKVELRRGFANLWREGDKWEADFDRVPLTDSRMRGSLRSAFNNRFVFLYSSEGSPEEKAWAYAKARFDAETWWMRGNGSAPLASEMDYGAEGRYVGRNLIVYGSHRTSALVKSKSTSDRWWRPGPARTGGAAPATDGIASMMIQPMGPWDEGTMAVIGGEDIKGMRATDLMPYFVSGVHYPEYISFRSTIYLEGTEAITAAGYFGPDWTWGSGDFAKRN